MVLLAWSAPAALAARSPGSATTIKELSDTIPLGILERSVGPKFYQSLLRSPIDDWTTVRARVTGSRLSRPRVIRSSKNPAYSSLALKFANDLTLVTANARQADSALLHLLVYRLADGVMAVSFAYPEIPAGQQSTDIGTVRLSVRTGNGPWTEIKGSGSGRERGRRIRRIDRMPMDVISVPRP